MLSCTSSNKLSKGKKSQRVPQNLDNEKDDRLWNGVERWATYPPGYNGIIHNTIIIIILSCLTSLDSSKPMQKRIPANHECLSTPITT